MRINNCSGTSGARLTSMTPDHLVRHLSPMTPRFAIAIFVVWLCASGGGHGKSETRARRCRCSDHGGKGGLRETESIFALLNLSGCHFPTPTYRLPFWRVCQLLYACLWRIARMEPRAPDDMQYRARLPLGHRSGFVLFVL